MGTPAQLAPQASQKRSQKQLAPHKRGDGWGKLEAKLRGACERDAADKSMTWHSKATMAARATLAGTDDDEHDDGDGDDDDGNGDHGERVLCFRHRILSASHAADGLQLAPQLARARKACS